MSTRRGTLSHRKSETANMESDNDVDMLNSEDESDGILDNIDSRGEHSDMYQMIIDLSRFLCSVQEDGEELAAGFQRIPNRRVLPDYFEVIAEPIAFSTIRGKIQKKQYNAFPEFVRDVAQICHNAQVYNRPSAPIFGAAVRLQQLFKLELDKLVEQDKITATAGAIPDLGDIPPVEESPSRDSDMEDDDDDEEVDDNEEEDYDDDFENSGRGRQSRKRRDADEDKDDEENNRRGRPPVVLTPMEARIGTILRGLRKFKDTSGNILIAPFEKLPDKAALPDYYETIRNPIAVDTIKKKAKRKKYVNVDQVLADINLMFDNAKTYNEDDSELYRAAVELQAQAVVMANEEKARPDDDFRDDDGKLALADIQYNGEIWRVGDWVHIRNPNDLAKPIVAQIFRMWQDRSGEKWINACWYYRPEQTVHRFEKHFFDHEVFKTGQYRDHPISEVVDHCFVMFVTRFNKGRPRGLPPSKSVYVCESRYNEEKFRFNKIKTWASCVPDEVRERDYEMDLFNAPRPMRKIPSPIKHLLREDAKETDDFPKPTWGSPNAPPIVGAVHRRPPESNESPPPEAMGTADTHLDSSRHASVAAREPLGQSPARAVPPGYPANGVVGSPNHFNTQVPPSGMNAAMTNAPHQSPVPVPQMPHVSQHSHPNARQMPAQQTQQQHGYMHGYTPGNMQTGGQPMPYQPAGASFASHTQSPQQHYASRTPAPVMHAAPGPHANAYNPPRPPEVYTLPENINEALPDDVKRGFERDREGRVLFFTAPPLDRPSKLAPTCAQLGHSIKYLAGHKSWVEERDRKRRERDETSPPQSKKLASGKALDLGGYDTAVQAREGLDQWFKHVDASTARMVNRLNSHE